MWSVKESTDADQKNAWIERFMQEGGFSHVLKSVLDFDTNKFSSQDADLSQVAFQMQLLQSNLESDNAANYLSDEQKSQLYTRSLETIKITQSSGLALNDDHQSLIVSCVKALVLTIGLQPQLSEQLMSKADSIEMVTAGLLSPSSRIASAVCDSFARLPDLVKADMDKYTQVRDYLLNQLSDKFFKQSVGEGKDCHMYLTLLNKLVQVRAQQTSGQLPIFADDNAVAKAILAVLVKLKTAKRDLKATPEQEEAKELMQRDLIEILKNILTQSGKSGQTIVQQNNVVETLFRDLLFKSYYHDLMGE